MTHSWLPAKTEACPRSTLEELRAAHGQLARMLVLLGASLDSLDEALDAGVDNGYADGSIGVPSLPEIDQFVGHVHAAIHYQTRAGQLIRLSLNRMTFAHATLKKSAVSPNNRVTPDGWNASLACPGQPLESAIATARQAA